MWRGCPGRIILGCQLLLLPSRSLPLDPFSGHMVHNVEIAALVCCSTIQPILPKTASKPSEGHSYSSSATENGNTSTPLNQLEGTVKENPEVNDMAAARAQLKARTGAKGRRSSRSGRGAGGHGQVSTDWKSNYFRGQPRCAALVGLYLCRRAGAKSGWSLE